MKRRAFIQYSYIGALGITVPDMLYSKDVVLGYGDHRYKVLQSWASNINGVKVNDCHEMVYDKNGRLILLTNETANNLIYFNKDGKILKTALSSVSGAHGLTLKELGGEEQLYLTDTDQGKIIVTTIEGKVIQTWTKPPIDQYKDTPYMPTETAVDDNGDVFVADGYGSQYIIHYDSQGHVLNIFGGRGEAEYHLDNAHGIALFNYKGRKSLVVTDRMKNKLKIFSKEGDLLASYHFPGAYICRPVIDDTNIYLATIWSGLGKPNSGMVTVLNHDMEVVSTLGGSIGVDDVMRQQIEVFKHPHDVCIDNDKNLYIPQWNAGKVFPSKLVRI